MAWTRIADRGAVPNGEASEFHIGDRRVAVINRGNLYALDAMCVHQDQPITCGKISDDIIECPHHFWHYNYKTGKLQDYLKDVSLQTYGIEERKDGIYIDL